MALKTDARGLREYLFVDENRLDLYLDQIEAPVLYDKVPEWNVELSLMGPKASGKQTRPPRQRTDHEKIEALGTYLAKNQLVATKRHWPFNQDRRDFYFERMKACPGFISSGAFELKIWICTDENGPDIGRWNKRCLILIQDFRGEDKYEHQFSSYSGLRLMLNELAWLNDTPLDFVPQGLFEHSQIEMEPTFDPHASLEKAGFKFASARNISTLYRLRACCYAATSKEDFCSTVIGYPIALWQ